MVQRARIPGRFAGICSPRSLQDAHFLNGFSFQCLMKSLMSKLPCSFERKREGGKGGNKVIGGVVNASLVFSNR